MVRQATNTGSDTVSRSTLLRLTAGENVHVFLALGTIAATSYKDTAFGGFMYEPKTFVPAQAWSVYRSFSLGGSR